ncbi:MAG: hypothetical protein KDJ72_07640 [Methyloceanibacter sp.]|uniref:hypothetical protein n=1 Tax=Methyloceanibacter sp. TaxID=1965321 RepID=UPI001DAEEA29|nr:hypothetical protein [Methyloceanibacter sp.]MCB1442881.1 hypothetical protein [Methyloceanibacter sp.]MCC0058657.1 hypothetical protein [Hyphomicrobiaceae bacterium]
MPGITFDDPLFAANAGVATDWAEAKGTALVKLPANLQLNRGAALELGLMGYLRGEAAFQKYVAAQITGQVGAQARVQGQIQMPMNLFREAGFAVRLQAIAEAAAGIEAGVGISIGDFIDLARSQLQLRGLPLQLFVIFMEEIDIGASFSAKAAFTAQAYANLVCTGTLVDDGTTRPGFNIAFGYGYGWKGGYGMRVSARAGFKDVSRLVARSVDVIVDETIDGILPSLSDDQTTERALLQASRPVAKIAARVAYETGEHLVTHASPFTADGAQRVALRVVQVILEECQRALLREMIDDALRSFEDWLETELSAIDGGTFASLRPQREALASHLRAMPREAFDLRDSAALDYWNTLSVLMTNMTVELAQRTAPLSGSQKKTLAQLWSAAQLMFAATVRMVRADASVSVIGLPPIQAKASFEGPLSAQPHALIRDTIADVVDSATGTRPAGDLSQQDLLIFLLEGGALATLVSSSPAVAAYLEPFEGSGLGAAKIDVARLMMTSMSSVMTNSAGELDAQLSLQEFAEGLRLFTHDKFEDIVVPAAHAAIPPHQAELSMYLDEVLLPSLRMVIDTGFNDILGWVNGTVSQTALEEALSSVLMAVFGRSIVVTGDILMAFTQQNFADLLERMAAEPGTPQNPDALLKLPGGFCESAADIIAPAVPLSAETISEELRVFLTIASSVARPFPPDVRKRMRNLMFDVIAPIPASQSDDFLQDLKNDLWIPNDRALVALGQEMMGQVGAQLSDFVGRLLVHAGETANDALDPALKQGAESFRKFVAGLANALALAAERLVELAGEIADQLAEIAVLATDLLERLGDLIQAIGGRVDVLVDTIAGALQATALPLLISSLPYQAVPQNLRQAVKQAMKQSIAGMLHTPVAAPLQAALSALEQATDDLTEALLVLDPDTGLESGLRSVLLDRLQAALPQNALSLPVAFDFSWTATVPFWEVSPQYPTGRWVEKEISQSVQFDLGNVELSLGQIFDFVEAQLFSGSAVTSALSATVDTLHDHLTATLAARILSDEQTTLRTEQAAMRKKQDRLAEDVGDARIAEPRAGQICRSPATLRIEIAGVGKTFATAQPDLPDRVAIYLNDRRLPLSAFTLDMLQDAKTLKTGISLTVPKQSSSLVEGINTLTLSAIGSDGTEHRMTNAFIVEADARPKERPAKERPIPSIDWPGKKGRSPKARPGAPVGSKNKKDMAARALKQMPAEPSDPVAGIAALSGKIAQTARQRFQSRDIQPVRKPKVVKAGRTKPESPLRKPKLRS